VDFSTMLLNTYLVFRTKPLRAFLALLGIIFGIGAVIAMVAVGEGARQEIHKKIQAMGANLVQVIPEKVEPEKQRENIQVSQGLNARDIHLLRQGLEGQGRLAFSSHFSLTAGEIHFQFPGLKILGISEDYLDLQRSRLVVGRTLMEQDFHRARPVFLMNPAAFQLIQEYFVSSGEQEDFLGQRFIRLNFSYFLPVGVVDFHRVNEPDITQAESLPTLYLPNSSLRLRLQPSPAYGEIDRILLEAKNLEDTVTVKSLAEEQLLRNHGQVADFSVQAPMELLLQARETQKVLNYVLLCIASISLLVGGIGIMNIMLANVLERIQEVGLRRAVGARSRDILIQFILESVFICLVGGLLGLLFGFGLANGMSHFAGMSAKFSLNTAWIAVGISLVVGLVFGTYPAHRATKISPMEALRSQG
jgi:putative ABC transport system permease protein